MILDGEIVTFNEEGRPDFGLLQSRMHLSGAKTVAEAAARRPAVWVVFDVLHIGGHDLFVPPPGTPATPGSQPLPYAPRRRLLEQLIEPGPNWQVPSSQLGDGAALLAAITDRGMEGIMAKRLDSLYEAGRRTPAWRKSKVRRAQELVVGGWRIGEGNRSGTIGSLLVGHYTEDGRLACAGRVGSGLTAPEIGELRSIFAATERASCPFDPPPTRDEQRGATWVEPHVVVEVAFGEWSRDGRLRHPSYLGRRSDKVPRSVVREPG